MLTQDAGDPDSVFCSAWENSNPDLLLSRNISAQGAGFSALSALSSTAVSFTALLIRTQESFDKEKEKKI